MSKFGTFIKNYATGWFSPFALVQALRGKKASSSFADYVDNYLLGKTGAGLTEAQQQTNTFTASEAQKQRDWETVMSNTAFQRQVSDMQAAGINPALMYGNGSSGASTPSGASASGTSPGSPSADIVGLLGQIANLRLLNSQRKNIDADTEAKKASADEARSRISLNKMTLRYYPDLTGANIDKIRSEIDLNKSNLGINDKRSLNIDADTALKDSQRFINDITKDWLPKLNAAKEAGDLGSAAAAYAASAWNRYQLNFTKTHNGQTPGYNSLYGVITALVDSVANHFGEDNASALIDRIFDGIQSSGGRYQSSGGR